MRNIPRKRLLISGFVLAFFLICIWFSPKLLFVNFTDSIPCGLYLRVPLENIQTGDIVAYMPSDEVVAFMRDRGWLKEGREPIPFLKYVGGIQGDSYAVIGHVFFINGEEIGDVLCNDSRGQALPYYQGAFIIHKGEFLPLSSDSKGFDGRYTGCVPLERVIAKAIPILVW